MYLAKYPRTPHLPFSQKPGRDDLVLKDLGHFSGKRLVITEKMDGENITSYKDAWHIRSLSSKTREHHWYFLTHILPNIQSKIDDDMRICGEYMFHEHAIRYDNLPSYYLVHSIWRENTCLDWDETNRICDELGLDTVPELAIISVDNKQVWDFVRGVATGVCSRGGEGIVVRNASSFTYENFSKNVAKYVGKGEI